MSIIPSLPLTLLTCCLDYLVFTGNKLLQTCLVCMHVICYRCCMFTIGLYLAHIYILALVTFLTHPYNVVKYLFILISDSISYPDCLIVSCYVTQYMMKIECLVLHKLQPEDFTESFYTKHGISSHAADHCKEMLQLWCNRPAGEILSDLCCKSTQYCGM